MSLKPDKPERERWLWSWQQGRSGSSQAKPNWVLIQIKIIHWRRYERQEEVEWNDAFDAVDWENQIHLSRSASSSKRANKLSATCHFQWAAGDVTSSAISKREFLWISWRAFARVNARLLMVRELFVTSWVYCETCWRPKLFINAALRGKEKATAACYEMKSPRQPRVYS